MSPFGATSIHGFSQELVCDVVANCHNIFTQEDLFNFAPTFSKNHAHHIIGLLSEIFDDIDETSLCSDETVCSEQYYHCGETIGLDQLFNNINDFDNLGDEFDELDNWED